MKPLLGPGCQDLPLWIEKDVSHRLPDSYKRFLVSSNGAVCEDGYEIPLATIADVEYSLWRFFGGLEPSGISKSSLRERASTVAWHAQHFTDGYPAIERMVPIADVFPSSLLLISTEGDDRGSIHLFSQFELSSPEPGLSDPAGMQSWRDFEHLWSECCERIRLVAEEE